MTSSVFGNVTSHAAEIFFGDVTSAPPPDFGPLLFALRKPLCFVLNIFIEIAFTLLAPTDAGTNSSTFRWMKPMWEAKLGFLLKKQTT